MEKSIRDFHNAVKPMRDFFLKEGFIEVHPQSERSILAACEDPTTMASYDYSGEVWPLPQTGQMWLERYLLENPIEKGFFCISTSYRQEPNPIPGRHDLIFPMFEFEMHGGIEALINLEFDLLKNIGFDMDIWDEIPYLNLAQHYGVDELTVEHEELAAKDISNIICLKHFPEHTSPFWNMKRDLHKNTSNKVDILLHGMETIGSAERETDEDIMENRFLTISGGEYANTLFSKFGKTRVLKELDHFLSLPMIKRCGGGIGMTRMVRAMKLEGIID